MCLVGCLATEICEVGCLATEICEVGCLAIHACEVGWFGCISVERFMGLLSNSTRV